MLRRERDLPADGVLRADVCIAGAGAAGITLARDLRDRGLEILLLESGDVDFDAQTQALGAGEVTGLDYTPLQDSRVRVLGGSTFHWAGMCRPLDPEDFTQRAWIAESGWPIDYRELAPYYRRAQATCELGPFEYDAGRLARRLAVSLLEVDPERLESLVYQLSPPTRFGARYRLDLHRAPDVRVQLGANLTEIRLDESRRRVSRFLCASLSGRRFEVEAGRYVLALGGIENPRLLLASREQISAGVANSSGTVGRYFMEHPHYLPAARIVARGMRDLRFYQLTHRVPGARREDEPEPDATIVGALGIPAQIREQERLLRVGCEAIVEPMTAGPTTAGEGAPLEPEWVKALLCRGRGEYRSLQLRLRGEQTPRADSRVTLSRETDALGVPRPRLDWRIAPDDAGNIRRSLLLMAAELGRAGLGRVWLPLDGEDYAGKLAWGYHHMGTTRMGSSSRSSVVNGDCRSHDVENLYVAGSSVFRTGGFANPTLTLVALAHRLADHLGATS